MPRQPATNGNGACHAPPEATPTTNVEGIVPSGAEAPPPAAPLSAEWSPLPIVQAVATATGSPVPLHQLAKPALAPFSLPIHDSEEGDLPEGVCPKCRGIGFLLSAQGAAPCDCTRQVELRQAWKLARVPRKFLGKTLDGFKARTPAQRHILSGARAFVRGFRGIESDDVTKGLLLRGKEGTGKTHVAIAALKEVVARGFSGLYWNVPELFLELRRLMGDKAAGDATEADLFDEARRVDLLVLDDLGAERTSDYVLDRLYVLINGRYQNDAPTIVTTNRTLEELRAQVGPRIASRLCEMCVDVEFPEGDYRRREMDRDARR